MKLARLIEILEQTLDKYGDIEVDILTETPTTGQVEQQLEDVAVSVSSNPTRKSRVKLLPEGF